MYGNCNDSGQLVRFREAVAELLLRPDATFNVLVPVEGAITFESIELIDPSDNMRQVVRGRYRAFMGWGDAAPKASEFVRQYEANRLSSSSAKPTFRRKYTFISVTVEACDLRAAAIKARQRVAEALDQYVAGHPFVQFDIDNVMGVNRVGMPWVQAISLRPQIEETVRPLAIPSPSTLRQAMRMSHLVRDALAPMTSVS